MKDIVNIKKYLEIHTSRAFSKVSQAIESKDIR